MEVLSTTARELYVEHVANIGRSALFVAEFFDFASRCGYAPSSDLKRLGSEILGKKDCQANDVHTASKSYGGVEWVVLKDQINHKAGAITASYSKIPICVCVCVCIRIHIYIHSHPGVDRPYIIHIRSTSRWFSICIYTRTHIELNEYKLRYRYILCIHVYTSLSLSLSLSA